MLFLFKPLFSPSPSLTELGLRFTASGRTTSPYSLLRGWSFPTLAMYTMGVESETMLPIAFLHVLFQIRQVVSVGYLSLFQNRDHLIDRDAGYFRGSGESDGALTVLV